MNLEKVSLIISLMGIIVLIFLAQNIEPKKVSISEINEKMIDDYVTIQGNLTEIRTVSGMQILQVNDGESINVVVYKKTNVTKGMKIEVQGKVLKYRESLEIEAQKVKVM